MFEKMQRKCVSNSVVLCEKPSFCYETATFTSQHTKCIVTVTFISLVCLKMTMHTVQQQIYQQCVLNKSAGE